MQFDHGNLAARPPRPILQPREDLIYDQIFKAYIRQDMFSDSPPENANATSLSSGVRAQRSQAGGNLTEHHAAFESIGPHELTRYPQERGYVSARKLEKSAEQPEPQVPDAYPDIPAQDQGNSSLQFPENAGVAMVDENMQNIPSLYGQPFTTLGFPNAPVQAQLVPGNTNISTPDVYPDAYPNDYLDQGNSSFQFAQSAGVAMANTNPQNIPSSYSQPFTSLRPPNASAQAQQPSNTNIFTPDAYPNDHLDQGNNSSFQFAQSAGFAMANTNLPNIPDSYEQFFTSLSNTNISTPDTYPEQQDVHLPPITPGQGNNSFQFALQSAGVAMANVNPQNIPGSYNQPFTSLNSPNLNLNAPAQVQQPRNAEQLQAFCQSLNPQARAYITALLAGAETARTQTRVLNNNPEINGAFTQQRGQPVYQSNSWNQTANTQTMRHLANQPQEGQWNRTANTHMSMTQPAIQSQMHSGYNALHAQAQTQMPFGLNVPVRPQNYQSQQMESKPAAVERMERRYGITIRPQDYGIFTQGQNPRLNPNKHNMNIASYGRRPQFVQGSSNDGGAFPETTPMKRKLEDEDEVLTPSRPPRRRRVSAETYKPEPQSSSSPPSSPPSSQADDDTSFYGDGNPIDSFFVSTKRGGKAGFSCRYRYPYDGSICHVFLSGRDKRPRYRHLSTHAQHEESLIAVGHLDVANAVMLLKLSKLVVTCEIAGCDWRKEVWRTDQVRENHEKECHPEAYMSRLQDRHDRQPRKLMKSVEV